MPDNRGRGPDTDEGRIEKNPSRPYENRQNDDDKKKNSDRSNDTNDRVNDILKKK